METKGGQKLFDTFSPKRKPRPKRITADDIGALYENAIAPGEAYKPTDEEFYGWLAEQINDFFGVK
jgi:hypothetical protein